VISEVGEHGIGSSLVDRQMLRSSHLAWHLEVFDCNCCTCEWVYRQKCTESTEVVRFLYVHSMQTTQSTRQKLQITTLHSHQSTTTSERTAIYTLNFSTK